MIRVFTQKRVCFSEVTNNCLRPIYNPIKNKPAVCQKRPAPKAHDRIDAPIRFAVGSPCADRAVEIVDERYGGVEIPFQRICIFRL